jgi:hypothetical protein
MRPLPFLILLVLATFILTTAHATSWADEHHDDHHGEHKAHHQQTDCAEGGRSQCTNFLQLEVVDLPKLDVGKAATIRFRLHRLSDKKALTFYDLKEVHTKKIHLFLNDQTLTDYHHLHPQPSANDPSVFVVSFTPKALGDYRLWLDVVQLPTPGPRVAYRSRPPHTPINGGPAALVVPALTPAKVGIVETVTNQVTVGGLTATLRFDPFPLRPAQAAVGNIVIRDADGKPLTMLEPILGAFAHVVAFEANGREIAHSHPIGQEPKNADERAGPELKFHLKHNFIGFVKIFVQVQVNGKDVIFPFGAVVEE